MNAADQRRLTPVLGIACVLCALVLGALVLGVGRGVHWGAAGKSSPLPAAAASARRSSPPLQQFAAVWQHPLFTTDRQPAPESDGGGGTVTLGDLQLTGIILTPDLRMALLHGRSEQDVRVLEGENVGSSGWTLVDLKPRSAVFSRNGQRTVLKLVVAGDTGGGATPAPSASGGKDNHRVMPATAVHPGRAAALRQRGKAKVSASPEPGAKAENSRQRRTQALKARIESRRRQMQAQQEQGQ
jgi:general secretion pathway protein N